MKISRPLIVLDLETTGVWIEKDKIVEIAMIKLSPDGKREVYHRRVNPGILIPPNVSEVIGITNEDVKNEPYFKTFAAEVLAFIGGCDLGGFNVERFDLPLLEREMFEAGIKFDWSRLTVFDAQKIYHLNERRDLTAAYKFYCDQELTNAHSAVADSEATLEVLAGQIKRYGEENENLDFFKDLNYKTLSDFYDQGRKFRWWNGELYPMFGKYAKRYSLQEIVRRDTKYLEWILRSDFSQEVKDLVDDALKGQFPVYQPESTIR